MREMDTLWERCQSGEINRADWAYEKRAKILDVTYSEDDLIKIEVTKGCVQDSFSLGNTIASELRMTVVPPVEHEVYYDAKVLYEVRIITRDDGDTPWYQFGHFYIKEATQVDDTWQLVCYDRLSRLNRPYKGADSSTTSAALNLILGQLGLTLDSRSQVNSFSGTITGLKEYTYREILGFIGSLNAGNWIVTESNQLRLIKPELNAPLVSVDEDNTKKLLRKLSVTYDKVVIRTGTNSEKEIIAGTGSNEFEVSDPWATQATANLILNQLLNFEINPENTQSSEMDLALEIGDTIEVDGKPVQLMSVDYSGQLFMSVNTPVEPEVYNKGRFTMGGGGDSDLEKVLGLDQCVRLTGWSFKNDPLHNCVVLPTEDTGNGFLFEQPMSQGESNPSEKVTTKVKGGSSIIGPIQIKAQNDQQRVDLSETDTSNARSVTFVDSAPNSIIGLNKINTSSAYTLYNAFLRTRMKSLNLLNFDTYNCETFEGMFDDSSCEVIDISSFAIRRKYQFDNWNITAPTQSCKNMFRNSDSLRKITLPNEVLSDNVYGMFEGCEMLSEVNLPDVLFQVENCERMFINTSSLKKVDLNRLYFVSNTNPTRSINWYQMFTGTGAEEISINQKAFDNLSTMDILNGPERAIASVNASSMFSGCENLKKISLPKREDGKFIFIDNASYMFRETISLEGILDLTGYDFNPTYVNWTTFDGCSASEIRVSESYNNRIFNMIQAVTDIPVSTW